MPPVIPRLVVEVFQREWFQGRRTIVLEPVPETRALGFENNISSVRIYKGPGYGSGANYKAIFWENPHFKGRRLVLGPGYYHSLHDFTYNFGNRISSISFASDSYVDGPVWGTVPVVVDLYDEPNFRGNRVTIVRDESRLDSRLTTTVRSMRLFKGPNCPPMGCRVHFFELPFFEGQSFPVELTRTDSIREIPDVERLPQKLPTVVQSVKIEGWAAASEFSQVVFQDEFDGVKLRDGWEWVDPKEGGFWQERLGWLQMSAEPGTFLWRGANFDAPRLLRFESGDFAIETRLRISDETHPYGGLLVWFHENAFVRLDKSPKDYLFGGDIRFEDHSPGREDTLVGRGTGLTDAVQLYLRIERKGNLFSGFASANGVDWVACGTTFVSMGDPVRVGLFAACPTGLAKTITRFDYFKILKRPVEVPLRSSTVVAPYRTPDHAQRVDIIRKIT